MRAWSRLAAASLAGWIGVVSTRGRFWLPGPWLTGDPESNDGAEPSSEETGWPAVVAVVPARDEAALLSETLPSLLTQSYPGPFRVVLVDDHSTDGTGELARRLASQHRVPCEVVEAGPTPERWAGKVWALAEGLRHGGPSDWLLFTDADVHHEPDVLRRLVSRGRIEGRDVVSVMAELRADSAWERLLVPAFVYFFALLYPFRWVSAGRRPAAAGGCLLVRARILEESGGLAAMRGAVIDDVSLARQVADAGGSLFLGLDAGVRSLRPYAGLGELWQMVARSAYTELEYSPARLAAALGGLGLLFAAPPAATLAGFGALCRRAPGAGAALGLGVGALALQSASYLPTIRLYRLGRRWCLTLPAAGLLYAAMTASSALDHHRGKPASWRGRQVATGRRASD